MSRIFLLVRALVVGCSLGVGSTVMSHDGPEHDIEELTERINKEGESAHLLLQRAIEYQVLGKFAEAAKDLERALQFETNSATTQQELSRAYFALGKTNEALQTVTRALKIVSEPPDHALLRVNAAVHYRRFWIPPNADVDTVGGVPSRRSGRAGVLLLPSM